MWLQPVALKTKAEGRKLHPKSRVSNPQNPWAKEGASFREEVVLNPGLDLR